MAFQAKAMLQGQTNAVNASPRLDGVTFLVASERPEIARQLAHILAGLGDVAQISESVETIERSIAHAAARVVFLDFTAPCHASSKLPITIELAKALSHLAPDLPRVAVGSLGCPECAIAALRAGVADFIDPVTAPQEAREVVARLLNTPTTSARRVATCRDALLVGARAGVGTSTLSAHLAAISQTRLLQVATNKRQGGDDAPEAAANSTPALSMRAALLDLGWPIGDAQLYMNVSGGFDFAEAARNLQRLDATLLNSAMAHTAQGLGVMALPADPSQMNPISQEDSLRVIDRLREHFASIVIDVGGFSNLDFIAQLARSSQATWLVTDQSVSSLVSLDSLLKELDRRQIARESLQLIVNRYDERYGMAAAQIAQRFGLEIAAVLPDRSLALMPCMNQGRLLHTFAKKDPYVRGVQSLAGRLFADSAPRDEGPRATFSRWLPGVLRRRGAAH